MIYLDNAATTPVHPEVLKAMMPYFTEKYGNAGAIYEFGRESAKAIKEARMQVADLFNAKPEQIVFTSGGSEGNNMVISYGMKEHLRKIGKKHIVISEIEHDSVYNAARNIFKPEGNKDIKDDFYIHFVKTNSDGTVDFSDFKHIISTDDKIGLVSIMYVNNETGAVNPMHEIGSICEQQKILFHTDCVQAAGCHKIDVENIQCDFATISGHKFHAPKGVGAIFIRNKSTINPLIYGGNYQEYGLKGGTENVPGIVGLGKACEIANLHFKQNNSLVSKNKKLFYETLEGQLKELDLTNILHINGAPPFEDGKVLNIRFNNIDGETLLLMLDVNGICVSSGSACHSHISKPSRVLLSMGLQPDEARDSIRISFSCVNTAAEVILAAKNIATCIRTLIGLGR